ncbi:MAG: alpha/beta fold hydrolase [Actinobacteria bacterium]|nr:alpha/beta fold hydrolase [Actinomycetota bacterium]
MVDDLLVAAGHEPLARHGRARRSGLSAAAAVNAVVAWAGAFGLVTGWVDLGERINDRLPFDSPLLAGFALVMFVAMPLTLLAWSAWQGAARTNDLAFITGLMLIGWVVVQVVVLRSFSLLQPLYLCVGAGFVTASHRVHLSPPRRGVLMVILGALVAATGVGLAPHLVKVGLSPTSVVSVVLVLTGIALLGAGARSALRNRRLAVKLVGGGFVLIVVLLSVSLIAPAVAATNVPTTHVTDTPSSRGIDHDDITLTTPDGVDLAGWYMKAGDADDVNATDGAGVVVLHGAGATRSDVLDQSAVLVEHGYAVLLLDARGHGDSRGTAMDFGWYGDLDVAAGIEFLASRPEIDPRRIGVVGFSMGGEEAIGAAATDPRVRAVVAEGATGRQAADKAWLSDAFGWRGWVQEQLEHVQDGITDFLTDASPPMSLRTAVDVADDTRFLLITAGNVDDEGRAAEFIQSGASERVTVWTIDGTDHTGGYDAQPQQWEQRVVEFLDESLT